MTPSQLIEVIAKSGLVDPKVVARLRKEAANPEKNIKPRAIVKYLVDKGEISAAIGERFLAGSGPGDEQDVGATRMAGGGPAGATRSAARGRTPAVEEAVEVPVEVELTQGYDPLQDMGGFGAAPGVGSAGMALSSGGSPAASGPQSTLSAAPTFSGKKDRRDQWKTKWIFVGAGLLGGLGIALVVLAMYVFSVEPEALFKAAEGSYQQQNWGDSRNKFGEFLEKFPGHSNVSHAKVRMVQCLVNQAYSSKNFPEAYQVIKDKIPTIENEPQIELIREDYKVWIPDIVLNFSEVGLTKKTVEEMKVALANAQESKEILAFLTSADKKQEFVTTKLDKIENNLKTVQGLINKETDYAAALVKINEFIPADKTNEAFRLFSELTRKYGDLGARKELRELMKKVTEREINLVKSASVSLNTSTADVPRSVDRELRLNSQSGTPTPSIQDELIPVLVEGYLYVLSGKQGDVVWSRFLGYETLMRPQWVNPATRDELLVFDQRTQEILRLGARDGQLVWRTIVGESFADPVIHNESVYVPTNSGKVIRLNVNSGEVVCAAQIPKSIQVPIAVAEQDPFIYVVGEDSNIYVLSAEDLTCSEVFYFGHAPKQIRTAPLYWTGHLLLLVNNDGAELQVLRINNKGLGLERIQIVRLADSMVSMPPTRLGRNMLVVSDSGDLTLTEMTISEELNPISVSTRAKYDTRGASRAFVLAQGNGVWIGSRGLNVFSMNKIKGEVSQGTIVQANDVFLAPMVRYDDVLVMTFRRANSRQISVAAVNANDRKLLWRSDFGAPAAGPVLAANDRLVSVSAQGDVFVWDPDTAGNVRQTAKSSDIDDPMNFTQLTRVADNRWTGVTVGQSSLVSVNLNPVESRLGMLREPGSGEGRQAALQLACEPISLSQDILAPALTGLIVRLDENGRSVGSPFQPPLAPGESVKWLRPVANSSDQIIVGDDKQNVFLLDASQRGSLQQVASLTSDGQVITGFVGNDSAAFAIARGNGKVKLLKFPFTAPFNTSAQAELAAGPASGPFLVGDVLLAHLENGRLQAWDLDCRPLWDAEIPNDKIAAIFPSTDSAELIVAFENGRLARVNQQGVMTPSADLRYPIRHQPLLFGNDVYFSTANGDVIVIGRDRL